MAHNMALSENRAKALADYIRRYDAIAPEMLHVGGRVRAGKVSSVCSATSRTC